MNSVIFRKLQRHVPFGPALPLLGIYPAGELVRVQVAHAPATHCQQVWRQPWGPCLEPVPTARHALWGTSSEGRGLCQSGLALAQEQHSPPALSCAVHRTPCAQRSVGGCRPLEAGRPTGGSDLFTSACWQAPHRVFCQRWGRAVPSTSLPALLPSCFILISNRGRDTTESLGLSACSPGAPRCRSAMAQLCPKPLMPVGGGPGGRQGRGSVVQAMAWAGAQVSCPQPCWVPTG